MEKLTPKKLYGKSHTINVWTKIISNKFNDLDFNGRESNIANILGITSIAEISKIKEASLNAFGESLGVKSFEDACVKLGVPKKLPSFNGLDNEQTKKFLAEYKLTIIIKALNEGWYPNWNNEGEYKYYPYFNLASGFSFWNTLDLITDTDVPSALVLKSNDLAIYCGKKFVNLYKDFYQ